MRTSTLAAAVFPLLIGCSPEDLAAIGSAPPPLQLNELSHAAVIRFDHGVARLTVTRQLRNDTVEYQQLERSLQIPSGAIATAFRMEVDHRWQPAELLGTEDADARWTLLTGEGEANPSALGALRWGSEDHLELELFGVAPGTTVEFTYELELPATYAEGGWEIDYPAGDEGAKAPTLHVSASSTVSEVRDGPQESGGSLTGWRIREARPAIDQAEAHWATYPLGENRTMWRLELDAAPVLEAAPARPNVVFVIDGSHSEGAEGIAAQLELLPGYLASVPDAQVEVVVYRRFAERLFGSFLPAAQVAARLEAEKARLAPGNGSNLELGAKAAVEALASRGGVGRIVVFTDEQLREGFTNEAAISQLKRAAPGTVVHLVARNASSGPELEERRDDDAELSPIAAAGGGVFLRVFGHSEDPEVGARVMLGLVRPIRIDGFKIEAKGLEVDQISTPEALVEGSTLRVNAIAEHPPGQVTLTGKIWARDFRRVVPTDDALADRMPGLAIGTDAILSQLTEDETRTAAMAARAVSPVTSYLSAPSDAAPSKIGVGEYSLGLSGRGGCGCCGGGSSHCGGMRFYPVTPDFESLLRELLASGAAACGASTGTLRIEATGDEVVAVEGSAGSPTVAACLTEAAWALRLPSEFTGHRTYRVELGSGSRVE